MTALTQAAEALRPFADACKLFDERQPDSGYAGAWITHADWEKPLLPRIGWFRRARSALAAVEAEIAQAPAELIARLRAQRYDNGRGSLILWPLPNLHDEAADCLATLSAELAEARAELLVRVESSPPFDHAGGDDL